MGTAVGDGIVQRNPCRVRGAGQDRSPERPVLSVGEVVALVEVMPERYRALVLLAAFGSLRWGELAALRRCDVDEEHGTIRVERSLTELAGGGRIFGPPKSAAGKRVVVVPTVIGPALAHHMTAAPPRPARSAVGAPIPASGPAARRREPAPGGSRVHRDSLDEIGARLYPCGIAAGTPQSFPAASLAAHAYRPGSSPPPPAAGARRFQPRSARFELAPDQGAVTHRFLSYSFPSRSPDPHHLAVLARPGFVRAAPALPGTTRIRLPSASPSCCDRTEAKVSHLHSNRQRLTAQGHVPPPGAPLDRERDIIAAGEPGQPAAQVLPAGRADLAAAHLPGAGIEIVEGDLFPVNVQPAYDGHRDLLKLRKGAHAPHANCLRGPS
jgi:hypothetical protein